MYDVDAIRAHFPALAGGTAFFDGPGGTQTPAVVGDAIRSTITGPLSNQGTVTESERRAEDTVNAARAAIADFTGAEPGGVVFGRSATALHYIVARALAATWTSGDEVVVSRLDHDANVRPWVQAAQSAGATVRWVDFDPDSADLTVDHVAAALSNRTRLLAITGASNLIGTRPDLPAIAAVAHEVGAHVHVDAVHLAAHEHIDLAGLGADTLSCSPYKFLGPHLGVLVGRMATLETIHPEKLLPSPDSVPERFEFGTLPYELLAGVTAAVDFLAGLDSAAAGTRRERLAASFEALHAHEEELRRHIEAGLAELPGATLRSRAPRRTPTLLVTFADRAATDAYRFLADRGVNAPAANFYAVETSRMLGLGDAGGLRIGLAPYNTRAEADRLLAGLAEFTGA